MRAVLMVALMVVDWAHGSADLKDNVMDSKLVAYLVAVTAVWMVGESAVWMVVMKVSPMVVRLDLKMEDVTVAK